MWQLLLAAAAAAGSGILANKLINPTHKPVSDFKQEDDKIYDQDSKFHEISDDGEIFRFSSPQTGPKELKKKKKSIGFRGLKKNGGAERGNKSGGGEGGGSKEEVVVDQRGKRISVCLKKRRTGKHIAGKCESCASKDNSFCYGVGIGMMCVMSTGKAEIGRLNCAMDETAKIVQELKVEILRKKTSCNDDGPLFAKRENQLTASGPTSIEAGERDEEQRPEVLEMDQLEAELESELQKLPWCATASSGSEERPDVFEENLMKAEILAKEDCQDLNLYQQDGVLPVELDNKLCHLLIERQESQIVELETELHEAQSKLQEKEAELQALKNCVKKRLSELSIASASSDEELEADKDEEEEVKTRDWTEESLRFVPARSIVGMKRTMGYESQAC